MGNVPDKHHNHQAQQSQTQVQQPFEKSSSPSDSAQEPVAQMRHHRSASATGRRQRTNSGQNFQRPANGTTTAESMRRRSLRMAMFTSNSSAAIQAVSMKPASLLTAGQKELIKGNWDSNRRYDICRRIYERAFTKRPDIKDIFQQMNGADHWVEEVKKFADFLEKIIHDLDDYDCMESMSSDMGRRHGEWRQHGFKSEFWVAFAESMTKECVYLDACVHQPGEVLEAWSTLVGLIFGWVRDGYYEKLRLQRRMSRNRIFIKAGSQSPRSSRSNSVDEPPAAPGVVAFTAPISLVSVDSVTSLEGTLV